ncbi:MAG: potassium transporter TrkA [Candidatus Thermoplasmatota archaeon]|nr:potassium transporter TrkA [Candidatus Thermoplasmatota archaeon]MBU1940183.1 potassium transporter TrkA [Candidatus Thermoplasmatota archaeon]
MKEKNHKRRTIFGRLQKTPKWQAEEFSEIEYKPTTVKELLTEMKDISELIIDLAYSAIVFDSDEIAEEVKYLDVRMDKLNYDIRMMAMMAARTKEDAEQLAGILQIAEAAESISNAAGDIANLLSLEEKTRPILPKILKNADEKLFRLEVSENSSACNRQIGQIRIESETGMRIIAIRRSNCWIYNPQSDISLKAKDWLIVRGTDEGFIDLRDFLSGKTGGLE